MKLNEVNSGIHKHKKVRRIGRGPGSGRGKTSTRGGKGQRARAGYKALATFQGGTTPLVRRVPKRGFHNRFALAIGAVNVADLERVFAAGDEVNSATLRAKGLLRHRYDELKILGTGDLSKSLKVTAHRFSVSAREKIEQAGGEIVLLPSRRVVAEEAAPVSET
jgi:large subunit ribosomal protein L15